MSTSMVSRVKHKQREFQLKIEQTTSTVAGVCLNGLLVLLIERSLIMTLNSPANIGNMFTRVAQGSYRSHQSGK